MNKYDFEKIEDNYINLYEEGIFIKCVEWSALILHEIFDYKLSPNCSKKTGIIFLEVGFPKNKKHEILNRLKSLGYSIRIFEKSGNSHLINGNIDIDKSRDKITDIKKDLIKFY